MTIEEFDNIRAAIKSAWPGKQIMPGRFEINLWYKALSDLDYQICQMALMEIITQSVFPPSIAELRKKCAEYTSAPVKSSGEAWEEVRLMVRKYGYYREEEALSSMDDLTRQAVKGVGFREICMSTNIAVERAHFLRLYDALVERKKQDAGTPAALLRYKQRCQKRIAHEQDSRTAIDGDGEGIPDSVRKALLCSVMWRTGGKSITRRGKKNTCRLLDATKKRNS